MQYKITRRMLTSAHCARNNYGKNLKVSLSLSEFDYLSNYIAVSGEYFEASLRRWNRVEETFRIYHCE